MDKRSYEERETEISGSYGGASGSYKTKTKGSKFPYGCKFCGRENVCSKYGYSWGRKECNDEKREEESKMGFIEKYGKRYF